MRRQLALLSYALGALVRRRGRNASLAAGLAFVVGLYASVLFLTDALRREFTLSIDHAPDLTVQRMVGGRPGLFDAGDADALRDLPAVRSAEPRVWGYLFAESLSANLTVLGLGPSRLASADLAGLVEGRAPEGPNEAACGAALATRLGLRPGDGMVIPVGDEPIVLEVVGLFRADSALHTADVVVVSEDDARRLLGLPPGAATDIAVELTTPDEADVIARHAADALGSVRVLDRRRLARTYELTFDGRAGLLSAALLPTLAALLLLAWDRLSGLGAVERREIGVLKAVGWETSDVLSARAWESLAVSAVGAGLGLVLAYLFVFYAGAPGLRGALFGWSALYPETDLVPAVDGAQLAALFGVVVIPFIAVSLVPAWRAATLDPDQAMRGTP